MGRAIRVDDLDDRARAIHWLGFSPLQAQFLVTVLLHSGVFVERQYCTFAHIRHGHWSVDLIRRLLRLGLAREVQPGPRHRGRLFHLHHKRVYRLVGEPDSRFRRAAPTARLIERVMVLDAVLDDPEWTWLASERDKMRHFQARLSDYRTELRDYPHLAFRSGSGETLRFFPDKLPIGVDRLGDAHLFIYLATRLSPVDFRAFMQRHAILWRLLRRVTLRVLVPPQFDTAVPAYRQAARDELLSSLSTSDAWELSWYFGELKRRATGGPETPEPRFVEAARRFRGPRFNALYRTWEGGNSNALWNTTTSGLADAFESGDATLEFVALTRPYLYLAHLVGTA